MKTLKLLAVLLSYPSAELVAALPEIARRLGAEPRAAPRAPRTRSPACWPN